MSAKERHQNPTRNDNVRLRLLLWNSNNFADPTSITGVDIYLLDPQAKTDLNPDGRTLVQQVPASSIVRESDGAYYADVLLAPPAYVVGNYLDVWKVQFEPDELVVGEENFFQVSPARWITSPMPIIYDFAFSFTPTKIVLGSKKYLQIQIDPIVPRQPDLVRYYQNLAIASELRVSVSQHCGPCVPAEEDLRIVVDNELVSVKDKCFAYYFLDTEGIGMEPGIYDMCFTLNFGGNVYKSDRQQLQVYK